jgi:hypothetical protein
VEIFVLRSGKSTEKYRSPRTSIEEFSYAPKPKARRFARRAIFYLSKIFLRFLHDLIHHAIGLCLFRGKPEVALGVFFHFRKRLTGALRKDLIQRAFVFNICRAEISISVAWPPIESTHHLVQKISEFGKRKPLALFAGASKERSHRCRDTDAHRRNIRLYELHRVVDRHAGRDRTAGLLI